MTLTTPEVGTAAHGVAGTPAIDTTDSIDVIDQLVGIEPGSALASLRDARPETRANAQASFNALFAPEYPGTVTGAERFALATYVIGLHEDALTRDFYLAGLRAEEGGAALATVVLDEVANGATTGPYGFYPEEPLSSENVDGLRYLVADQNRDILGSRLVAALEHAHLLVFRPRESSASALQALLDAGWSTTDIVTISQLVAFLSFQVRVIGGLRLLAADLAATAASAASDSSVSASKGI